MRKSKLWIKCLLVLCLCLPMAFTVVYANDDEKVEPLPSNVGNITSIIEPEVKGGWAYIDKLGFHLNVKYVCQNPNTSLYGKEISPEHIKDQWLVCNDDDPVYFVKDSKTIKDLSKYNLDKWGGYTLYTTWDNGKTEHKDFLAYTWVFVNYYDINSLETIHDRNYQLVYYNSSKSPSLTSHSNGDYDVTTYDAIDIPGYRHVQTDGKELLKGNISSLNGVTNINVWYAKQFNVTYKDGNNGETFEDQSYTVDENSETPKFDGTPKREGYKFIGWDKDVADTVTEDVVYTAQWEESSATGSDDTEPTDNKDTTKKEAVKTGDNTDLGLYLGISLVAVVTLAGVAVLKKKMM